MPKDKIRRFAEFKQFDHCFDFPYELKGKWRSDVFKNNNPIAVELGCGKGEYSISLADTFPDKNFIGIDIKSNRMWRGAGIAKEQGLHNVAFARLLMYKITEVFAQAEVDEIWITFPDPFPKLRHAKHRLTHPRYLTLYKQILKPGGLVNFKTDSDELFHFTIDMLPQVGITPLAIDHDVHHNPNASAYLKEIKTYYEQKFMAKGQKIKYTQFLLDTFDITKGIAFEEAQEAERKRLAKKESE
ncbi:MAG: tRNA (guanosine(46)-N7)-methyltransferase TrmB [Bacteroidota bacterium]|jgi:tRNA (guanine-N7-)-methyltransferase|nr:tRNA (guanosine(46)-N7)-methyltransferase TrmB [Sphingobacteriales bacterium]